MGLNSLMNVGAVTVFVGRKGVEEYSFGEMIVEKFKCNEMLNLF